VSRIEIPIGFRKDQDPYILKSRCEDENNYGQNVLARRTASQERRRTKLV
jgi:hypothetical protein